MSLFPDLARDAIGLAFGLAAVTLAAQTTYKPSPGEIPPPKTEPMVVNPGPPPSDAVVLFDGKDLSKWVGRDGGPAKWEVRDGAMVVAPKTGDLTTKESFGDVQLHLEWATPEKVEGESQGRGNSGVFLMNRYELQILDSYENPTYWHGQAGSIYKQWAPLVNVSRKPGEWQIYDVVFHAPTFDAAGAVVKPATMTAFHNGVLIQDHAAIKGTTTHQGGPKYQAHPAEQPIRLQDHGNPMRFRNIWIRRLAPRAE